MNRCNENNRQRHCPTKSSSSNKWLFFYFSFFVHQCKLHNENDRWRQTQQAENNEPNYWHKWTTLLDKTLNRIVVKIHKYRLGCYSRFWISLLELRIDRTLLQHTMTNLTKYRLNYAMRLHQTTNEWTAMVPWAAEVSLAIRNYAKLFN